MWHQVAGRPAGRPADYAVRQEEGVGQVVENKKAGLKVKVPEGWTVEKIAVEQGSMIFYSPDAEGVRAGKPRPPLKQGCVIEVAVAYKETSLDDLRKEIEIAHKNLAMTSDSFQATEVDSFPALRNLNNCKELGPAVAMYILVGKRLIGASIFATTTDTEKCFQEFDKFLETVSIE